MRTHSRYMTGRATACASLLLGLALWTGAAAQDAPAAESLETLTARADKGNAAAMRELAVRYYAGRDAPLDYAQAAGWYRKLAARGDVRAQTTLGLMYLRGNGVARSYADAYKWWSFAAAQNDPGAQYNLGSLYFQGLGVKQDDAEAARWYREAAMRGHVQAQEDLGMMYFDGRGVAKNVQQAYYLTRLASLQGSPSATEALPRLKPWLSAEEVKEADAKSDAWLASGKKLWFATPAQQGK